MKLLLICSIFILTVVAVAAELTDDEIFSNYLATFRIPFRRKVNFDTIKANVVRRFRAIEEGNRKYSKGEETFNSTMYPFAHLSDEEFAKAYLGAPPVDEKDKIYMNETDRRGRMATPPEDYFRWPESVVGKVKNQGQCGSCYAFAAIGVIKSRRVLKYGGSVSQYDLSEQDAMECTRGCTGGWDHIIYRDYSQKYGGCAAYNYQRVHAYSAVSYTCQATSRPRVPNTRVKGYVYLQNNEKTIREYLYNYGPLYTRYDVFSNFYDYSRGIYTSIGNSRYSGGHAGE